MLILLGSIVLVAIGLGMILWAERWNKKHHDYRTSIICIENTGITVFICGGFVLIIALCIMFFNNIDSHGAKEQVLAEREALVFQLENHVYEYQVNGADIDSMKDEGHPIISSNISNNSFTLVEGKRDLYNAITEFNKNAAYYKSLNDSIWTNIFFPNYWSEIELIPLQ